MHKRLVPALLGRYSTCVSVLFVPQYDSYIAYGSGKQINLQSHKAVLFSKSTGYMADIRTMRA